MIRLVTHPSNLSTVTADNCQTSIGNLHFEGKKLNCNVKLLFYVTNASDSQMNMQMWLFPPIKAAVSASGHVAGVDVAM